MDVAIGETYSIGLTVTGEVFIWGEFLQVKVSTPSPLPVPDNKRIVSIASGSRHIAIVAEDGTVYTCGEGGSWFRGGGQLGHGKRESQERPK